MKIELKGVSHCIDGKMLLKDINFVVDCGQCLVVSGRSGKGKSLLFSIVCGILQPQQGEVLVNDKSLCDMSNQEYDALRRSLGAVFHVSALISNLTLRENLMLPLNQHLAELTCVEKQAMVQQISHEFGLIDYLDKRTDQLSTGQGSLAGLARALVLNPCCLVWDAPLAEIDLHWIDYVSHRLRLLKQQGTSLILFTNRVILREQMADFQLDLT